MLNKDVAEDVNSPLHFFDSNLKHINHILNSDK